MTLSIIHEQEEQQEEENKNQKEIPSSNLATEHKETQSYHSNKDVIKFLAGNSCRYPVVRETVQKLGWKLIGEDASEQKKKSCNVLWVDTSNIKDFFNSISSWQCINHFPGMTNIARKTRMADLLSMMRKEFKKQYSFYPKTYILPRDLSSFRKNFGSTSGKSRYTYIVKPDGGCQGRGIFLTKSWSQVENLTSTYVAQKYIMNPLLIDNKKFDLRIYVLITSCDPLRMYIFRDGLVRLCTEDFEKPNAGNIDDKCMHLTNYAINKLSQSYIKDETGESFGSKRSVKWFLSWISQKEGKETSDTLWRNIGDICVKTIISVAPLLAREYRTIFGSSQMSRGDHGENLTDHYSDLTNNNTIPNKMHTPSLKREISGSRCFAILGFDIMIDDKLRPNLIEVNHLPSFATDSELDNAIKSKLMYQALASVKALPSDQRIYEAKAKSKQNKRLFQQTHDYTLINNDDTNIHRIPWKNTEAIEEYILKIYSEYAPEKVDKVKALMNKYQGHEEWLVKKLKEKYCIESKVQEQVPSENSLELLGDGGISKDKVEDLIEDEVHDVTMNVIMDEQESVTDASSNHEEDESSLDGENISPDENCENVDEYEEDPELEEEENLLEVNGDYDRIYPPKQNRIKLPPYRKMMMHAFDYDMKQHMRRTCPLWKYRMYDNSHESKDVTLHQNEDHKIRYKRYHEDSNFAHQTQKVQQLQSRLIHPPTQKQIEAAERMTKGFPAEDQTKKRSDNPSLHEEDPSSRLQLAEQQGKEIRRRNEEKYTQRSQLLLNPINLEFSQNIQSSQHHFRQNDRYYVDFTGRRVGF